MKLSSCFLLAYNIIRFGVMKLTHGKNFDIHGICFIYPKTKLKIGKGMAAIGKSVVIEENGYISTSVGGKLTIGNHTFINRNCYIGCRNLITIGDHCIIGPNVSIYDHNHMFDKEKIYKNEYRTGEVVIENGCWIGDGAKILKGSHIGEGSVIGAGAVVSSEIEPHSIVKMGSNVIVPIK